MEIWKDVIGYEGLYKISSIGNIKSLNYGRTKKEMCLKPGKDTRGYFKIDLCKNKIKKTKTLHQLVAIAFLNHKPCGYEFVVNHKNFIRTDNRVENLEIVTARENSNLKHLKSSSKYVGVGWHKQKQKWQSRIHIDGKLKHLGTFKTEIEAHNAYQKALCEL